MTLSFFHRPEHAARPSLQVATEVQSTVFRITRLTLTAVAAFLIALALLPMYASRPLLAPLTALLVVQYSVYETIKSSIMRVLSVASGVLLAVFFAETVGFSWWSLGMTILAALSVGHGLRLGEHILEVPISAMLIFALGSASHSAAAGRIVETLIGAATGLVAALLVPSVRVRPAEEAVQDISARLAALLQGVADDLQGVPEEDEAAHWQAEAERLAHDISRTDRALGAAEESVRLNPRARRFVDAGVALRNAVETMEHFTLSLRGLMRSLADDERLDGTGRVLTDRALRPEFAEMIAALARTIAAYGLLARSDLDRDARPYHAEEELDRCVRVAHGHRERLARMLQEHGGASDRWPLYGEISMDLARLLEYLRVEHRTRAREQWRRHRGAERHLPERPLRVVRRAGHHLRRAAAAAAATAERNARDSGSPYHFR
jgi:hypothetical protein